MKQLYDNVSFDLSKRVTNAYSTSFSLGIRSLDKKLHKPIYAIYGFVRFADEIVDSFHEFKKEALLDSFEAETWRSLNEGISLNPILNAFQATVNKYNIEKDLIAAFFYSMRMDLDKTAYKTDSYEKYIYGSAEVVGLMCLAVFTAGDQQAYERLKPSAQRLGAAFQKINFLRDLKADYELLGRSYFPGIDLKVFCDKTKAEIEDEIRADFDAGLQGILKLPKGAKFGVYLAYIYYRSLFNKIKKTPASTIMEQRIRIPNFKKLSLWCFSYCRYKLQLS